MRTYDELNECLGTEMNADERKCYFPMAIYECSIWENKAIMYLGWFEAFLLDKERTYDEFSYMIRTRENLLENAKKYPDWHLCREYLHAGVVEKSHLLDKFEVGETYYTIDAKTKGLEYHTVIDRTDNYIEWRYSYDKVVRSVVDVEDGYEVSCLVGGHKMDCRRLAIDNDGYCGPLGYAE